MYLAQMYMMFMTCMHALLTQSKKIFFYEYLHDYLRCIRGMILFACYLRENNDNNVTHFNYHCYNEVTVIILLRLQ